MLRNLFFKFPRTRWDRAQTTRLHCKRIPRDFISENYMLAKMVIEIFVFAWMFQLQKSTFKFQLVLIVPCSYREIKENF